ncbi:MAG: tetratricopeptide repeat protein [Acidobacteria bacterium]|nr:tetratricopeptide repeat protein [Acidobacteriota bacterium]MBI3663166.1 tetratricopeptide repeat protein [Acidobacteriota bacterium]
MLTRTLALAFVLAAGTATAAEKPETWVEACSPHFRVISNAGEKQARRAAGQFERFRDVLHHVLPKARVDSATPMLILAVKDEKSLKALIPEFWKTKGSTHPAGVFLRSTGKDFVALRLDVEGVDPYHVLYHEYTHSLMALNFGTLPVWVGEGLAEFFGHAEIGEKEAGTGRPSAYQLGLLQAKHLLPIETLLTADKKSPYYNEADKTSLFYAQSWALTHYFMLGDKGARQSQLLKYLTLVDQGVPELEAAQRTFGDLKHLANQLEGYVRLAQYFYLGVKLGAASDEKQYAVREVPEAEALAARGNFLLHDSRTAEARAMLEEALRLDPQQGLAHEGLGFYYLRQGNREEAARHFAEAIRFDPANYLAHYHYAMLSAAKPDAAGTDLVEIHLRKAIELNAEFARAYWALASHYAVRGIKLEEALQLALKAAQLEPGELAHHINVASVLLHMGRADEAVGIAQRALKAARSDDQRAALQSFLLHATQVQGRLAQKKRDEEESAAAQKQGEVEKARREQERKAAEEIARQQEAAAQKASKPGKSPAGVSRAAGRPAAMEGKVANVTCGPGMAIDLTLGTGSAAMLLHADNYFKIEFYSTNWRPPDNFQPCQHLGGLAVKVAYNAVQGKPYVGEILAIEVKR